MGCGASGRKSATVDVVSDVTAWNDQYAQLTRTRHAQLTRSTTKAPGRQATSSLELPISLERLTAPVGAVVGATLGTITSTLNLTQGKPPRVINGFTFGEMLGKGAFGSVYLASRNGVQCAIKVMKKPAPAAWHPMKPRTGSQFNTIRPRLPP